MIEPSLPDETGGNDIDGLSGRILRRERGAAGSEQVLEPDLHVSRSGVETGTSRGRLGDGAGALVVNASEQTAALLRIGKECGVVHVERVESALCKQGC